MVGLAIHERAFRRRRSGAAPPPVPISAVAADGWQATMIAPADLALSPVSVSRQGYDATGAATTHSETLYTTKRVRQAYPNQAALTVDTVALSDYVYSTDTIAGVTNNSTEASPKPVANWSMADRKVVGNSLTLSLVAFHRNGRAGRPVAAVAFRATDGTTTVTATASALTATVDPLTGNVIQEYVATLDITSLTDNANVTANAKVYPWIGGAGSVRDSADLSSQWQFSPRTFRKDTARAANPPLVYVASGGNDSTGYVGTDAALAAASPCATPVGAINRVRAVLGTSAGSLDGLRVRLTAGTWSRSGGPTPNTVNAAIVIEPAPGVAKTSCIFEFGAANNDFELLYVHMKGLTIRRVGGWYLHSWTGYVTTVEDCTWDWNGNTSTNALGNQTATHNFINVDFGAVTSGIGLGEATNPALALMRGCTGGAANAGAAVEMLTFIGNTMWGVVQSEAARAQDNRVIAFNKLLGVGAPGDIVLRVSLGSTVSGFALVQNVIEYAAAGGTAQRSFMPSGDSGTPNVEHLIEWHNTYAGFDAYGRHNALYDETPGSLGDATKRRLHKLQSYVGNILVQLNTKSDIFCGNNSIADAPNRTGNWAFRHGVGCRGVFVRYRNASGTTGAGYEQDYPGIGSVVGTSNTGAGLDPLFTSYQGTTSGPTAGAGGGDYTIGALSPAKGLVTGSPLAVDLAGNARSGTVAAGAYV